MKCPFRDDSKCPMKDCPYLKSLDFNKLENKCPYFQRQNMENKCPYFQRQKKVRFESSPDIIDPLLMNQD
jgi:hypothetical protein